MNLHYIKDLYDKYQVVISVVVIIAVSVYAYTAGHDLGCWLKKKFN